MQYVFKRGTSEIEFTADSDRAAWSYIVENHSCSRTHALRSETLYRIDRVPVERPTAEQLRKHEQLIATFNKVRTT